MKPIIGIIPLWDDTQSSLWMLPGYMDIIRESGAIPIMLPLDIESEDLRQLCDLCSGFLLTGGHDISPALYGETPSEKCGTICKRRDTLESAVLEYAIEHDKALLGICRGIQFINGYCGGTLYQDLPSERPEGVSHQMVAPYDAVWHTVRIIEGSPLSQIIRKETIGVNSYHHQAVKELSPQLEAMAISEDGLIEALYMPQKRFIWALQWHPEFSFASDEKSRKIVELFISKC